MRQFLTSARCPAPRPDVMELRSSGLKHVQHHKRGKNGEIHPCFPPGKLSLESFHRKVFPGKCSLERFPWKVFPGKCSLESADTVFFAGQTGALGSRNSETYHRSDRLLNSRFGVLNRWAFKPWKVFGLSPGKFRYGYAASQALTRVTLPPDRNPNNGDHS